MQTLLVMLLALAAGCRAASLMEELEKSGATTLIGLLKSSGLDATLASVLTGFFTLFAPTNQAFTALPQDLQVLLSNNATALTQVLAYHAVPAIFRASDVFDNLQLVTADNGQKIRINVYTDGEGTPVITAEGGRVVDADIMATNGYIHLVDRVLMPPSGDLYKLVASALELSTFKSLIDTAGLRSQLTEILLYHMTASVVFGAGAFNGTYVTQDMYTHLDVLTGADGVTYINHARVIMGDIPGTNGVMHVLDKVLMPAKYALGIIGK